MSQRQTNPKLPVRLALLNQIPTGLILFFLFLAVYSFTMSGRIQYGDEVEKYRVAQSIVERHDLSFRPTAQRNETGVGGRTYSIYEMGQTVLEIPFYAAGSFLNGWSAIADVNSLGQLFVGFLNPLLTALTAVVLYQAGLVLGFAAPVSVGLSLVYGLATIAWPYSKGFTREPALALFLLLSVYGVLRFQKKNQFAWLLAAGAAAGYLVFTKFIHGVVIPVLLIYVLLVVLYDHKQNWREALGPMLKTTFVFLLPSLLALLFQTVYSFARFGKWTAGLGGSRVDPVSWILLLLRDMHPWDAVQGLLVSPDKSIFLYSLPILLFPFAWAKWFRVQRREALLIVALLLAEVATVLFRPDWNGGSWWGPRYLVQITPLLILPLGALVGQKDAGRIWRPSLTVLSVLGLSIQLVGASANSRDYLDATGNIISLAGQIDFLRHGALDSMFVYWDSGAPVNPFGILLVAAAILQSLWLARRMRATIEFPSSNRAGLAFAMLAVFVLAASLVAWVVTPLTRVLAGVGNTKYTSGEMFTADGRTREANTFYLEALDLGTDYTGASVERLTSSWPRGTGVPITADDLVANAEFTGQGLVSRDDDTSLSGTSLRTTIPPAHDANARGVSAPIPVSANTPYQLTGWMKAEGVYGTGAGAMSLYEDDGNWGNRRTTEIGVLDETTGWRPFYKTLTTLPTTRRIFVAAGLWNTYGTLWIDRIELTELQR